MSILDLFRRHDRMTSTRSDDVVTRSPRAEWRSLPVIHTVQRSRGPLATLDPMFGQRLATAQAPSFLDDLGHGVSTSAPGGLITGFAVPDTTAHGDGARRTSDGSVRASELTGARRIEFTPTTVGTLVTPAPTTPTMSRAPIPPVQRRLEVIPPSAMQGTTGVEPSFESAARGPVAPLLGADDGGMLHDPTGIAHAPSGNEIVGTGAPAPSPPAMPGQMIKSPGDRSGPAAPYQPIQREAESDSVHQHTTTPPTVSADAKGAEHADEGALWSPASDANHPAVHGSEAQDRPADVVPTLSRSRAPLPMRPRIGGPLGPGERSRARRSTTEPSSEPVRSPALAPAPAIDTAMGVAATLQRSTEDEAPSPPSTPSPVSHSLPDTPLAREWSDASDASRATIAPLSGVVALSQRFPTDAPRPAGHAQVARTTAPAAGEVVPRGVETTDRGHAARAAEVGSTPRPDRSMAVVHLQRHVAEPGSALETAAAPTEPSPAKVRSTIGRDGTFTSWAWSSPQHVSPQHGSPQHGPPQHGPPQHNRSGAVAVDVPASAVNSSAVTANLQRAVVPRRPDTGGAPASVAVSPAPTATIPPSIAHAVAWASEVTPRGRVILDALASDAVQTGALSTATSSTPPLPTVEPSTGMLWRSQTPAPEMPASPPTPSAPFVQRRVDPAADAGAGPGRDTASDESPDGFRLRADWLPVQTARDGPPLAQSVEPPTTEHGERSGGSPFSEASEADVIGLMRTMYPHLRRRLSRDLLLERDRAGHRTDIRF